MNDLFGAVLHGKTEPTEKITLRDYQVEALEAVKTARAEGITRCLVVLFTSAGKTTVFTSQAVEEFNNGRRTLIIVHREELVEQIKNRLISQGGITPGICTGLVKENLSARVIVAGVATVGQKSGKALSRLLEYGEFDTLIVDECHHASADSYVRVADTCGVNSGDPNKFHLGVTATDHRMDNKPLHGSARSIYDQRVFNYPLSKGIKNGYATDIVAYRLDLGLDLRGMKKQAGDFKIKELSEKVNVRELTDVALDQWKELAGDKKTIVFCTDVAHAEAVKVAFEDRGVLVDCVSGNTPKAERGDIVDRFRGGELQVLTNCNIATEGFDVPDIGCVLLMRPTQSWSLFAQMVGRGVRLAPGKDKVIVIDIGGISDKMNLAKMPALFGLPEGLKTKGQSMKDALESYDELLPWQKQRLEGKEFDFGDIANLISRVDIIGDSRLSDEVIEFSTFSWFKISEDRYTLNGGTKSGFSTKERVATILMTAVDAKLVLHDMEKSISLGDSSNLKDVFRMADDAIRENWGNVTVADTNANWRKQPISEGQLNLLKSKLLKVGYSLDELESLKKGEASLIIEQLKRNGWKASAKN